MHAPRRSGICGGDGHLSVADADGGGCSADQLRRAGGAGSTRTCVSIRHRRRGAARSRWAQRLALIRPCTADVGVREPIALRTQRSARRPARWRRHGSHVGARRRAARRAARGDPRGGRSGRAHDPRSALPDRRRTSIRCGAACCALSRDMCDPHLDARAVRDRALVAALPTCMPRWSRQVGRTTAATASCGGRSVRRGRSRSRSAAFAALRRRGFRDSSSALHLLANTYCAGRWFSSEISGAIGPSVLTPRSAILSALSGLLKHGSAAVGS